MEKRKAMIALSASAAVITAAVIGGTSPGSAMGTAWSIARQTAYLSAGITIPANAQAAEWTVEAAPPQTNEETEEARLPAQAAAPDIPALTSEETSLPADDEPVNAARVISRNITPFDDGLDYTAAGNMSGAIVREHFAGYQGTDYIQLPGGGLVWNCTNDSPELIRNAGSTLPELKIELNSPDPQVLIVHTHTTESYEPYQRSYYDSEFPYRTKDPEHNVTRIGEVLAQRLADQGISVLHDGTIHDSPTYTGAYDRSEATIRAALEEYPSIKVVIDLHRDAVYCDDGSRKAPVAEINGSSAAQFMIIAGCDDGRFGNMPYYEQNLSLACLIQDAAEALYPGLARPVLFDYRNYNQHISTGSLLIEVGGHANSLDEAVYTGELLGDCMAKALKQLT